MDSQDSLAILPYFQGIYLKCSWLLATFYQQSRITSPFWDSTYFARRVLPIPSLPFSLPANELISLRKQAIRREYLHPPSSRFLPAPVVCLPPCYNHWPVCAPDLRSILPYVHRSHLLSLLTDFASAISASVSAHQFSLLSWIIPRCAEIEPTKSKKPTKWNKPKQIQLDSRAPAYSYCSIFLLLLTATWAMTSSSQFLYMNAILPLQQLPRHSVKPYQASDCSQHWPFWRSVTLCVTHTWL